MSYQRFDNGASLCGFDSLNGDEYSANLIFPIEAYKAFLKAKNLPFPEQWKQEQKGELPQPIVKELIDDTKKKEEGQKQTSIKAPDDMEVVDGVTVGALTRYIAEFNPPLAQILPHLIEWFERSDERRTSDSLSALLQLKAKVEKWGTKDKTGALSKKQAEAINWLLLPSSKGGPNNGRPFTVTEEPIKVES